jgi:hypothetical protein
MKHTDAEIEDAARRFEHLADNLDPAGVAPEDLSDLRAVAEAAEQVRRDAAYPGRPPATGSLTRSADPIPRSSDEATRNPPC